MRRRTGTISESQKSLLQLERQYRHQPQELRLKALRLLKEEPSLTLRQVAELLGRCERTLQRWWKTYQKEGLEGLLKFSKGGGKKPLRIGETGLRELEQRLQRDGFADLVEIQRWLAERFGVTYSLSGVWYLVRLKLKAKLKSGRPRAAKQDAEAVEAFKKKGLSEVANLKVFAQDETRFGLKTWHRRRWMAKGYRPDWVGQQRYEWFYLYGAVEPLSGRSLFWILPDWKKESVQFFVERLREEVEGEVALVWDRAGSHRALADEMPEGITPVFLPRASPELNPIEQVWKALRKKLANRIFERLKELEEAVCEALREYWEKPEVVISMTAYPWWREALQK